MKRIFLTIAAILLAVMLTGCLDIPIGTATTTKAVNTTATVYTEKALTTEAPGTETGAAVTTAPVTTASVTTADPCAAGHTWGAWTVTLAPTYETEGSETRSCARCTATEIRTVAKKQVLVPLSAAEYYGRAYLSSCNNGTKLVSLYDAIATLVGGFGDKLDTLSFGVSRDTMKLVYLCVARDYPEYFWIEGSYSFSANTSDIVTFIQPDYNMSAEDLPAAKAAFSAAAEKLLAKVDGSMGEYEIARLLHNALVDVNVYDSTYEASQTHTAYGALVNHTSVCEGYAKAYQYLLTQCGIKSAIITGKGGNENHAWNVICLDGKYYPVDVTWDDPVGAGNTLSYEYFCSSTALFSAEHTAGSENYALPSCETAGASYYEKMGLTASFTGTSLVDAIAAAGARGVRDSFSILLDNSIRTSDVGEMLNSLDYNRIMTVLGLNSLTSVSYTLSSSGRVLTLIFG